MQTTSKHLNPVLATRCNSLGYRAYRQQEAYKQRTDFYRDGPLSVRLRFSQEWLRSTIFWDVTCCNPIICLCLPHVYFWLRASLTLQPKICGQYVLPKRQSTSTGHHGIISQRRVPFTATAVRAPNSTNLCPMGSIHCGTSTALLAACFPDLLFHHGVSETSVNYRATFQKLVLFTKICVGWGKVKLSL